MGVTRKVIEEGTGTEKPQKGDEVTVEYTGNLYDAEVGPEKDYRGKTFDSSIGRGDFKTQIGVGKVIRGASDLYTPEDVAIDGYNLGWDEGVMEMVVGEKSILTVSGDYAYSGRGFPGIIPPNATLIFEVELKAINGKKAKV